MDSIEGLLKEIAEKSGKPRDEIKGMIEEKP